MNLTPGALISNRYRLIRQIWIGGFSVVWLVVDELMGGHEFALKVYAPDRGLDDPGLRQFQREYLMTVKLNHTNLLKPSHYDIFEGSPYLIMPFCEGGSLSSLLQRKGNLGEEEVALVLFQICGALNYLHGEGIVHQDIKPDNILIGDLGKYLLTDFGISAKMRSTLRKSTNTGKALTVAYAPPERFRGIQISGASGDIFSIGVMIFELVTGDVPWMGVGGIVLRPDSELPELPKGYSKDLEELMRRCLSYAPEERPSAIELTNAAEFCLKKGIWDDRKPKDNGNSKIKSNPRVTQDLKRNYQEESDNVKEEISDKDFFYPYERSYFLGRKTLVSVLLVGGILKIFYFSGFDITNPGAGNLIGIVIIFSLIFWALFSGDTRSSEKKVKVEDPKEMIRIGLMYQNGNGLKKDFNEARRWFMKAGELGSSDGFNNVGVLYFSGMGVEIDYLEAKKWYLKAAEMGNKLALSNLGELYELGLGVNRDLDIAKEWYEKGKRVGEFNSIKSLERLEKI